MRRFLFGLATLTLFSCTTDVLVPCDSGGTQGEPCREYRYFNGSPQGYIEFSHEGDSLFISDHYNENSALIKTIREHFENGRTTVISEQYPTKDSRIQTWHYNDKDSLEMIVFGANDSTVRIDYGQDRRTRESYFHGMELIRYSEYRYYQDDGKLYRISAYTAADSLLAYRQFDYFSTGQSRASYFNSAHHLIGREVFTTQNGLMTSIEFTDSTGTVTERADYVYDAAMKLTEKTQRKGKQTYKSVFLYY